MTILTGANDYAITAALAERRNAFDGAAERVEGSDLTREKLADIFAGQTLFSQKRLIVVDTPSASAELWQDLEAWTTRLSDDTKLIFVEPGLDKRTTAYKWLQKNAEIIHYDLLDVRQPRTIEQWLKTEASNRGLSLTDSQVRRLVQRGGNDQWALSHAIDKLLLVDQISDEMIDHVIESSPLESVFALIEAAMNGNTKHLQSILVGVRQQEDPYRLMGLLISQSLQLSALALGEGNIVSVASDIGAKSSYPLQKLAPVAHRLSRAQVSKLVRVLATADTRLKQSDADPWTVVEHALVEIASL